MKLLTIIKDKLNGKVPSGTSRSSKWPKIRDNFLKTNTKCVVCNGTKNLEVHHKNPFHLHPELELDVNNLIVLCESKLNGINCHLAVGHLGSYKSFNPKVDEDSLCINKKLKSRKKNI